MKAVYPGTFCPPTKGHLEVVEAAARRFEHVFVICANRNTDKKNIRWFDPETCVQMWKTYSLPANVEVVTADDVAHLDLRSCTLVRGIRACDLGSDATHTLSNIEDAFRNFGMKEVWITISSSNVSSTRVRNSVELGKFDEIRDMAYEVTPHIMRRLWMHVLGIRDIYLITGRVGSGKSTFAKNLVELSLDYHLIKCDQFNELIKPILKKQFPGENLIEKLVKSPHEMMRPIARVWGSALIEEIAQVPRDKILLIECAFGLESHSELYRLLTPNIIHVFVDDEEINAERLRIRGTPQHTPLIRSVMSFRKVWEKACDEHLYIDWISSVGHLNLLQEYAEILNETLHDRSGLYVDRYPPVIFPSALALASEK